MSLMSALLETYDFALERGLVDCTMIDNKCPVLLPVYHSSKKSGGEDIFEITIDKNSVAVDGKFLGKDERVVFPITEDSIIRSGSKIAPHAVCDELSYLSREIDPLKNEEYIKGIEELLKYEKANNCESFKIIGNYIIKNTILVDFLKFCLKSKKYTIDDKFKVIIELENTGEKAVSKTLDLNKIFITFKIERENEGDISLTNDKDIHKFYIGYVKSKNSSRELSYCDITGKLDYCVERHRGIIGNAKLISISNNDETYYGRFKSGGDIYHISYETSQKVHNMLKYLVDDTRYSSFIGEGAYVINWLSNELEKGGIKLLSEFKEGDASVKDGSWDEGIDEDEDGITDEDEATMTELGGGISRRIGAYFLGKGGEIDFEGDFYVLIIEKISNGRISIKHFRRLSRSDAYERLKYWYKTIEWKLGKHLKTPSVYQIVDFLYGYENDKGFLKCEKNALRRSQIERLIPCLTDSKRIPR
ncbi:MAG TPA: type I-C CRISPR-associated protein Cas8c/Csd1, partial [Sedimentibacter sp.]|nr:type I-C CRISPR-associated protein Cas8c/Csd1 [Sedimentibacter sp.]